MTRETYDTISSTIDSIRQINETYSCLMQVKNMLLDQCDHKYPDGISSETNGWCEICKKRI